MKLLSQHIESLVFTSEKPIKLKEIKSILEETFETKFKNADLEGALEEIEKRYEGDDYAFEMVGIAEGYQFLTKGSYFNTVATFLKQTTRKRLSRAALETLSIIAYKQPVSRPELERIRGVSCDYAIHKLLEKEMVTILGRSEAPGRPLLYGTSEKFMDYFGLKTLNDMPKPRDFSTPENSIGEAAPIEEDTPNPNAKPRLELPITELDEVVDMLAAILPEGPRLEIQEEEEEEIAPTPNAPQQLELPVTDLEEVVDMIAAVLPEEPKVEVLEEEEVQPTAATTESKPLTEIEQVVDTLASTLPKESQAKENEPVANQATETKGEVAPIVPQASSTESQGNAKPESSEKNEPTIAELFAEAIKSKSTSETSKPIQKVEDSIKASEIIPSVASASSQESAKPESSEKKEPTIAQLFTEAIKSKSTSETSRPIQKVEDSIKETKEPTSSTGIIPPTESQEISKPEIVENKVPTIAQLFAEAIKSKSINETSVPVVKPDDLTTITETTKTDELDDVVDVISASIPIENIPSESIVLDELIKKGMVSSEEE